ncbi:hypothetical protein HDZ31DRAFT_78422, partial [Schizophyllum fasciatum]
MPSEKQICHCSLRCGGPDGPGRPFATKTIRKHERDDRAHNARVLLASTSTHNDLLVQVSTSSSRGVPRKRAADTEPSTDMPQRSDKRRREDDFTPAPGSGHEGLDIEPSLENEADVFDTSGDACGKTPPPEQVVRDGSSHGNSAAASSCGDGNSSEDEEEGATEMSCGRENSRDVEIPEDFSEAETPTPRFNPVLEDLKVSMSFINLLKEASLDDEIEALPSDIINQIRNPPQYPAAIDNPDHRYSLELFLSLTNASVDEYNGARRAYLRRHPNSEVLSFHAVKKLVCELSGIVEVKRDMCDNSCIGFTGPYRNLEHCPYCGESRYEPAAARGKGSRTKRPRKQFTTILLGPQIQAQRRGPETSRLMQYREKCTRAVLDELEANSGIKQSPFSDYIDGSDYLEAVQDGRIAPDDS